MRKPAVFLSLIQKYHILFTWLAIWAASFLISSSHQSFTVALVITNITLSPILMTWLLLNYLLIPRLLYAHRGWFFFCCFVALVCISVIATEVDSYFYMIMYKSGDLQLPPKVAQEVDNNGSPRYFLRAKYVTLLLATMAVTTVARLLDEHKRISRQAKENRTQLELKYLRAQMNPHFLFNALNCIYTLTLIKDERAADSVMSLSEMLRYVIDDCQADEVPLYKEIANMRNYIAFQEIRMEKKADVTFDVEASDQNLPVPPMVFQPLIENCFKHSRIMDHPDGFVHIRLSQTGTALTFTAENSIPQPGYKNEDKERLGIGLQNVKQRLDLLYGSKYTFKQNNGQNKFNVEICIKF